MSERASDARDSSTSEAQARIATRGPVARVLSKFEAKDWITVPLALLAFLISGLTAYLNFRSVDDLRMVIGENPTISRHTDGVSVRVSGSHQLSFINMGNRQVSITRARLLVVQPETIAPTFFQQQITCDLDRADWLRYGLKPIIIKPGEISVQELTFRNANSPETIAEHILEPSEINRARRIYRIVTCLELSIVTPDSIRHIKKAIQQYEIEENRTLRFSAYNILEPLTLFQASGFFRRSLQQDLVPKD